MPRPPWVRTQREHWPAPLPDLEDVEAGDVAEDREVVLAVALGAPHEAGVAEEGAVGGLVLVGVAVPVGTVGVARLTLGDGPSLDPHGLRQVVLHVREPSRRPGHAKTGAPDRRPARCAGSLRGTRFSP